MSLISLIHPSRNRPDKSEETISRWLEYCYGPPVDLVVSLDENDHYLHHYRQVYADPCVIVNNNRSCVDAINNAAKVARGDIFVVVSDDSDCFPGWDTALLKEVEGKSDFMLKTNDGIQDYIVTLPILDRSYYNRDGFIYHPQYAHQFCDTFMTCVADIRGRLIKSHLDFPHLHYSHLKEQPDALNKRNDDTWKEGQKTFVRLMKQFTPEERARIKDPSMRGFLKHVGL